jgi:hypothetical protein
MSVCVFWVRTVEIEWLKSYDGLWKPKSEMQGKAWHFVTCGCAYHLAGLDWHAEMSCDEFGFYGIVGY